MSAKYLLHALRVLLFLLLEVRAPETDLIQTAVPGGAQAMKSNKAVNTSTLVFRADRAIKRSQMEDLRKLCEQNDLSSVSYVILEKAVASRRSKVLKDVLRVCPTLDPNTILELVVFTQTETFMLEALCEDTRLEPSGRENFLFFELMYEQNFEMAKILYNHPNFKFDERVKRCIVESGVGFMMDSYGGTVDNTLAQANLYTHFWKEPDEQTIFGFDLTVLLDAFNSPPADLPDGDDDLEENIFHLFLDSHSTLFGQAGMPLSGNLEVLYKLFRDMLLNTRLLFGSTLSNTDNAKIGQVLQTISQFEMREQGNMSQIEKPSEPSGFDNHAYRIEPEQEHTFHLAFCLHSAVATFKSTSANDGIWTVYNTGDGTLPVKDGRIPAYQRFHGVKKDWVKNVLKVRTTECNFSDIAYPKDIPAVSSSTKIAGQRAGTCKSEAIWLYLLVKLGRPLYTKLKTAAVVNLLNSIYSSLNVPASNELKYDDQTFQSDYMPVWKYIKESLALERALFSKINKMMTKTRVELDDDVGVAENSDLSAELIENHNQITKAAGEACRKVINAHLATHKLHL